MRRYFSDLWQIITRPSLFFRRMPLGRGVSGPLAFALVTHWLGTALQFLWGALLGGGYLRRFQDLMEIAEDVAEIDSPGRGTAMFELKDRLTHWFWGAGSVIIDPFYTLASILFTAIFVYAGARILVTPGRDGAPQQITFESSLRIICYGMSPSILAAVPIAGAAIAWIAVLVVTVIGAREVYRIDTARAIVVALFPKLLFLGIIVSGMFLLLAAFLQFFLSAF